MLRGVSIFGRGIGQLVYIEVMGACMGVLNWATKPPLCLEVYTK